jgi:hypothetical protein
MTTKFVTDEQLGILARRQNDLFRRVREGTLPVESILSKLQALIEGDFDAVPNPSGRIIDCDAQPYIPEGWRIERHIPGGQIEFDPNKVELWLSDEQHQGTIIGNKLRPLVERRPGLILNANVLDHLLKNTALIPESWKQDDQGRTRYIYFWGTIYRDSGDSLCVRFLFWNDGRWSWSSGWLGREFVAQNPAALFAS